MKLILLFAGLLFLRPAAADEPIQYTDASTLTVIGKALPTERAYNRIDTTHYRFSEAAVANYCYHSVGIAVLFRTDSRTIRARWETSNRRYGANMTAIAQKGLDLYIRKNGEWVFAGTASPSMSDKATRHNAPIVSDMAEGEKECLLYLPMFDKVDKLEIGTDENSSISPIENPFRHKIVVHGSSLTHGTSAGRSGMIYSALMSRSTGLYFINLGFSGRCTMQPEFGKYLADVEADAFILDCFSNPSAAVINERFDAFVDAIRATHPTTPLIFIQTLHRETRNFSQKIEKFESEKMAASEAQIRERMKHDKNIYFISPGVVIGDDHNATTDGIHPSDLGFDRMVAHVEPQIVKILRKYGIK